MSRVKLSSEEKALKEAETIKQRIEDCLLSSFKDLMKHVEKGFIPEPTIFYKVGDRVQWGNHLHTTIAEIHADGKIYKVHNKYETKNEKFEKAKTVDDYSFLLWNDLVPYRTKEDNAKIENFSENEYFNLNYFQSTIGSFSTTVYHFGVDTNPEYQRDYVWSEEDKVSLIDSIFKNIEIGKFVFIRRNYDERKNKTSHLYEILDGKQRLNAITEFWEGRLKYKGKTFFELSWKDQNHFEGFRISMAEVADMTDEQILKYFVRLNTSGRPVHAEHLEKVKKMIKT